MSPTIPECVDGAVFRTWIACAEAGLDRARDQIDEINVFPVPDRDTGTNLYRTLADPGCTPAATVGELACGMRTRARGSSGTILAEYFTGLSTVEMPWDRVTLSAAFQAGAWAAHRAVSAPQVGTILTAARAAADAATRTAADHRATVTDIVRAAVQGAHESAARSVENLPALARAGVLDAGAVGLTVILGALHEAMTGERYDPGPMSVPTPMIDVVEQCADTGFEVMVTLVGRTRSWDDVTAALGPYAQSIVRTGDVAPDTDAVRVHLHTQDPGALVSAIAELGLRTEEMRVHRLDCPAPTDVAVIAITSAPALLVDLASSVDLVQLYDTQIDGASIARTCLATGAERVVALVAGVTDPVVRDAEHVLAGLGTPAELVQVANEAALVASLATALESGGHPWTPTCLDHLRVAAHHPAWRIADAAALAPASARLVTVVLDRDVDHHAVHRWVQAATQAGTEVTVLDSGRAGTHIDFAAGETT